MCGISIIINKKRNSVESDKIKLINNLITHRGPDGEGFYFGENFAFGHRRLSIIDLSDDGKQPMIYKEDNVITYNGEIYNYIELRDELIQKGYSFKSKSDTEVILAAYDFWGKDCVRRFNGMWSFCIFDRKKNIIFGSRDRFGVKPFYYLDSNNEFVVGSEIKQLLPFLTIRKVNRQTLLDYMITGMEEFNNETFFENILKLEQGHNLIYDLSNNKFSIEAYYSLDFSDKNKGLSEKECVKRYKNQLEDSIKLRMRSDVEVGVCLSGGLDSSSITAFASEQLKNVSEKKIKAFHVHINEKNIDESNYAKFVADEKEVDLIFVEPNSNSFLENLNEVIKIQEEPFGSPSIILQYFVLQEARKNRCLVLLDGQGGDETLLGYERYYPAVLLKSKGFNLLRDFINSSKNSRLSKIDLLKYLMYFTNYKLRIKKLKARNNFIKSEILSSFESPILKEVASKYTDLEQLQKLEISKTQLPHLLKYEDKNSMAHSVESRLPFLDYRCVELALSLPEKYKIKKGWTKYILRKAVENHLPEKVIWRRDKLGFNAPEKTWLELYMNEIKIDIDKSEILDHIIDKSKFSLEKLDLRTQWRLFNIARWESIYQVKW